MMLCYKAEISTIDDPPDPKAYSLGSQRTSSYFLLVPSDLVSQHLLWECLHPCHQEWHFDCSPVAVNLHYL